MSVEVPWELWLVFWTTVGLFVGSFLNVAIHRLPQEGMGVNEPKRSLCPSCGKMLTWSENIPLLSWMIQRGRCRGCGWSIPWRYPLVEASTAALWLLTLLATPQGEWSLFGVRVLVLSGLMVATAVDFAIFEIPDEVSIGGMVLAPILALLVPALHVDTWVAQRFSEGAVVDAAGSLAGCLAGMLLGGGVLLAIGWAGKRAFGREAMGFGDVKLLSGAGGFIGPGGVVTALILASVVASVAGLGNILRFLWLSRARVRARGATKPFSRSVRSARIAGRYVPFGPYLALGIGVVLLYWRQVQAVLGF